MNSETPHPRVRSAIADAVLETAVDAIITIDALGLIRSANAACERIFGYAAAEIIGKNVTVLMAPPYRDEHEDYIRRYLESGQKRILGIGREVEGRRKDGSVFPIELAVSEVRVGKRRLFTGIVRDITPRRALENEIREREERYRSLVENSGVVIIVLAPDHTILEWNSPAEEVYGCGREQVLGKDYFENFLPERHHEDVAREIKSILAGKRTVNFENPILRADGRQRLLLWNAGRLLDSAGKPIGVVACGRDITEFREAQRQLVEQQALAKLGEMTAMVAHEIKNPLAGILGATRLLRERLPDASRERDICEEMISRTMALDASVKDILTFARPKKPSPRLVPARILIEDVITLLSGDPLFERIAVVLKAGDERVHCDIEMIKPVFVNILMNAAQAIDGTGEITITILPTEPKNEIGLTRFVVSDSGPGIPEKTLTRIFEPFFTTKGAGTGLGLPIAERLVTLHGGAIKVESNGDDGTSVTIDLPASAPE